METWLRERLAAVIEGDWIILSRGLQGECTYVLVGVFVELFAPDVTVPSYSNLVAADGEKGYGVYIRAWHDAGWI